MWKPSLRIRLSQWVEAQIISSSEGKVMGVMGGVGGGVGVMETFG